MKNRLLLPTLLSFTLATGGAHAAIGTFAGTVGDPFWDIDASNWTGVTGNAWDATNGPNNVAQFNPGNANPVTAGPVVANGIIWNASGGVGGGSVKLDGSNPFLNVSVSGSTSQFFANLTGTSGFTKTGVGQFFLIGSVKGITGGFTVNQGLLRLDLDTAGTASGVVNSSNTITLSGSILELHGRGGGVASSQTLDNFTLNTGGSTIRTNLNGGSGVTLSLANWTRTSGTNSSVLMDTSSGSGNKITLTGTLPPLSNGIIGGYATIRDSTGYGFATLSGNDVVRYTATSIGVALGADSDSSTNYITTAAGNLFNGSGTTQYLNSLDVNFAGNVSGNNAATYVLGSGGLMFSYTSGFPGYRADMNFTSATSELQVSVLPFNDGFASATIRSVADNGGTSVSLIKAGTGGLNMGSGTFTYTGHTVVNQGVLSNIANIPSGTGKGNLVVNSLGTVAIGLGSGGGNRTINGLSNTTLGGGTVNNQNHSGTAATSFLDLGNNDATATFSGVITGISIIKSGSGTQTFSGANTYAGTTTVNAGTLLVNNPMGSGTGTGEVTVGVNGTLGGTGSIVPTGANGVTVNGTVRLLDAATADLDINLAGTGNAVFSSGAKFSMELGAMSAADVVDFAGLSDSTVAFNGNAVDLTGLAGVAAGTYTLFTFDTASKYTGTLVKGALAGGITDAVFNYNASDITVTITTSAASPYDTWALGPFANPFTSTAPGVDFDNDGLNNLLEFVLGGDPTISQSGIAPAVTSASGSDLVLTFKRSDVSENAPATAVKVQVGTDLLTWNPADEIIIGGSNGSGPNGATYTITNSGGFDNVTVTIPKAAAARKFARVIAIQP